MSEEVRPVGAAERVVAWVQRAFAIAFFPGTLIFAIALWFVPSFEIPFAARFGIMLMPLVVVSILADVRKSFVPKHLRPNSPQGWFYLWQAEANARREARRARRST